MDNLHFSYPSSISQIVSLNDSFSSAILSICYPGLNRNKTIISREAIDRAIPTMAYCPIVANYSVEEDTIGGHDVEIVKGGDGSIRMVNVTDAIGVVPENPDVFWEVKDDNGVEHIYLSTPIILWKRAAVYQKIRQDGIENQSMEITVNKGHWTDAGYEIDDFSFTAFCILGEDIEPCFESASVELYSADSFRVRYNEMLEEFKREFSAAVPDGAAKENLLKGGDGEMNREELMLKYGLTAEDIDFAMGDMSDEELEARFAQIRDKKAAFNAQDEQDQQDDEPAAEEHEDESGEGEPEESHEERFSLTAQQFMDALCEALCVETYEDPYWGVCTRFYYCDHDIEPAMVYMYDSQDDWKLYGAEYVMNGDCVSVDFDGKKRMKVAYVELDEGEDARTYGAAFAKMNEVHCAKMDDAREEIRTLTEFKHNAVEAQRKSEIDAVFAKFAVLEGDEAFVDLVENYGDMTPEAVEDKCYAILGRKSISGNFALNVPAGTTRLPIEDEQATNSNEPYGGIFRKFGIGQH